MTENNSIFTNATLTSELPPTLKANGLFCNWRYEYDKDGRKTKIPYNPKTGHKARSNDPATFSDLATAERRQKQLPGVGVGVFGNIAGIDIDHCVTDSGELDSLARDIVTKMDTYTEISPSGTGLRILFTLPAGYEYDREKYYIKNPDKQKPIEIYTPGNTSRFLTLTGNTITPGKDIEERGEELRAVVSEYMQRPEKPKTNQAPPERLSLSDNDLLQRIRGSENAALFNALFAGNWEGLGYESQSSADAALMSTLAFWTQCDADQMERLFSQSGLAERDKWRIREDYRRRTIQNAISNCDKTRDPNYYKATERPQSHETAPADKIPIENNKTPVCSNYGLVEGNETDPTEEEGPASVIDKFLQNIYTEKYKPIKTGVTDLDAALYGGCIPETLTLIGAAPGAGKTCLCTQIFEEWARQGQPCIYFNLEMSTDQLIARSLSRLIYKETGNKLSMIAVLQGYRQSKEDRQRVAEAAELYRETIEPCMKYNPDNVGANLSGILDYLDRIASEQVKQGKPAPHIAIDYLQILEGDPREETAETLKRAVNGLKSYAKKYGVCVFGIVAQNRKANEADGATMAAGRDTSALEYSADVLLQLKHDNKDPEDILTLYLTKSRFTKASQDKGYKLKFAGGQSCIESPEPWEVSEEAANYKRF